jgi:hypothetical protein
MLAKPGYLPAPATPVEVSLMTAPTAATGELPSPANSSHSIRSLRSEALSQLSINPAVTVRKVSCIPPPAPPLSGMFMQTQYALILSSLS